MLKNGFLSAVENLSLRCGVKKMGKHHDFGPKMKIPDYRIYKIEDAPELVELQRVLEAKGLKDPWLRNEVWRFNREYGTPFTRTKQFFLKGVKWGFVAFLATIAIDKAWSLASPSKHDGGHHGDHH